MGATDFGTAERFGRLQGLMSNYVTDIAQDRRGILWIASEAGLHRFDGHSFTRYSNDIPGMAGNTLTSIRYDKEKDRLWIGTKSGLSCLDLLTGSFIDPALPKEALTYNISDITPASDGGVWIVNHYTTITHVGSDGKCDVLSVADIPGLPDSFTTVADDGNGHLVVGHTENGISIIDLKKRTARNYSHGLPGCEAMPEGRVNDILVDLHRNIWFATNHGLTLFLPESGTFLNFSHSDSDPTSLSSDRVFSLSEDSDGLIWAGCDMGNVSIFNPADPSAVLRGTINFSNHNVKQDARGISNGNIHSVFEDRDGNIWVANYGAGLEFISHAQSPFRHIPYFDSPTKGLDNTVIWSTFTDTDGTILLGATNSIGLFDGDNVYRVINFPRELGLTYSRVTALGRSGEDILVGLYDDGLLRLNRDSGAMSRVDLGKKDLGINVIYNDPELGTLIGTSQGLWCYRDGKASPMHKVSAAIRGLSVSGVFRHLDGTLWISTLGNSIFIFDRTLSRMAHIDPSHFKGGMMKGMCLDSHGRVWVLNKGGIASLRRSGKIGGGIIKITRYLAPSQKSGRNFRGITQDRSGNIWVSSDNGLHMFDNSQERFLSFESGQELALSNFNDRAVCVGPEGVLVFGGIQGACMFDPEIVRMSRNPGAAVIVECSTAAEGNATPDRRVWPPMNEIKTGYDNSSVRIVFTTPDFAYSKSIEYSVMLEGMDPGWSQPMKTNEITYRNLPPGKYTFKVRSRLPNQKWDNANMASVGINIAPPFWKSWWATLVYIAIVIAGILIWIKFYKRRLNYHGSLEIERKKNQNQQELNEERLRFYTNITHELRTPLTLILGPLEDLMTDRKLPPAYKGKIAVIHNSSLQLLNLINQILEFRKTETQNRTLTVSRRDLGSFVTEIGLRYKELNRNEKVEFVIDVDKMTDDIYFDTDVITTVLNNLLSNAVKYTPAGRITLSLKERDINGLEYAEITVADTGYGIEADALPHIFDRYYQAKGKHQASGTGIGLALVKSLTELHGGELEVESKPGEGATFRFRILTGNIYPDALHNDSDESTADAEDTEEAENADNRPKVLVVEDNPDIRQYICKSLCDDYNVVEAADGMEGLETALKENPDIIVTDVMMPVMDGITMLRKLKGNILTSHIPVVLLTAKDSISDKEKGYLHGADSYLTKPFSAKLLHSRLSNILETRQRMKDALAAQFRQGVGDAEVAGHPSPDAESASATPLPELSALGRFDREFLQTLTKIVEDNISSPQLDLSFILDRMNMTHSTFYRKIKGLTGMSGNEFIQKVRLNHTIRLLQEKGCTVSDAAYESGFNDLGHFRRLFKKEFGVAPSQYIRNFHGKQQ